MNNLLKVAEGILDKAAEEYIIENLLSTESVRAYAENGCDITLLNEDAEKVFTACCQWTSGVESGELNGSNDYYSTVKKPLLGDNATL